MSAATRHNYIRFEPHANARLRGQGDPRLRLLSFNMQAGMETQSYRHYVTRSWQHVLPGKSKLRNLHRISELLRDYDLVGLQEADGGSLRSGFVNQVEYLAKLGNFPCWHQQCTRDFGHFGRYGNGLLSRFEPLDLEEHKLPGAMPGRGAIFMRYGDDDHHLIVINLHLALGRRSQHQQLGYIRELIEQFEHVVIMGDMNTHAEELLDHGPLNGSGLYSPACSRIKTYPSWAPRRTLDHILVSDSVRVTNTWTPDFTLSDHLPVALELELPQGFPLHRAG